MELALAVLIASAIGYVVGGARTASRINARYGAERTQLRELALKAFEAHDAARKAWDEALGDQWARGVACGAGAPVDPEKVAATRSKADASIAAAEAAHKQSRATWASLRAGWGD